MRSWKAGKAGLGAREANWVTSVRAVVCQAGVTVGVLWEPANWGGPVV